MKYLKFLPRPTLDSPQYAWMPTNLGVQPDTAAPRQGMFAQTTQFKLLDVNGDGLTDVLEGRFVGKLNPQDPTKRRMILWVNTGTGFLELSLPGNTPVAPDGTSQSYQLSDFDFRRSTIVDFDGDGRDDLLVGDVNPPVVFRAKAGVQFEVLKLMSAAPLGGLPLAGDFNGDGSVDLLGFQERTITAGRMQPGRLKRVVDGLGKQTEVSYDLFAGSGVYSSTTEDTDASCSAESVGALDWSARCLSRVSGLATVIKESQVINSSTGPVTKPGPLSFFRYRNARIGVGGRGFFGFGARFVNVFDDKGNSVAQERVEYHNDVFELAGRMRFEQSQSAFSQDTDVARSAARLRETTQTWDVRRSAALRSFPVLTKRITRVADVIGATNAPSLVFNIDDFDYDDYGNLTSEEHTVTRGTSASPDLTKIIGHGKTIRQYDNVTSPWQIGLLRFQQTTSDRNGYSDSTTSRLDYYPNGLLKILTREPDDPTRTDLKLVTTLARDDFNDVHEIKLEDSAGKLRHMLVDYDARHVLPRKVTSFPNAADPAGQSTVMDHYLRHGVVKFTVDPNSLAAQWSYDGFGRLGAMASPTTNAALTYTADSLATPFTDLTVYAALRVATTVQKGAHIEDAYDAFGNLVQQRTVGLKDEGATTASTVDSEFLHDWAGRVLAASLPHATGNQSQGLVKYERDLLGRVTKETLPDGATVERKYGTANTLLKHQDLLTTNEALEAIIGLDPLKHETTTVLDHTGRPVTIDASGRTNSYTYGEFNRTRKVHDPKQNDITMEYDGLGRVKTLQDPNLGQQSYTYWAFGELRKHTDANQLATERFYDDMGRLTEVQDETGTQISGFSYDGPGQFAIGQLVEAVRSAGADQTLSSTTHYAYNGKGLLEQVDRAVGDQTFSSTFEYDEFSRPTIVHYPDALDQHFGTFTAFDDFGHATAVYKLDEYVQAQQGGTAAIPFLKLTQADQGFRLKQEHFKNGVTTTREYYSLSGTFPECSDPGLSCLPGRLRAISSALDGTPVSAPPIQGLTYTYDLLGNVKSRADIRRRGAETFVYDELNQLQQTTVPPLTTAPASETSSTFAYTYDSIGNLLTKTGVGTYQYTDTSHPYQVTHAGENAYQYDANGNQFLRQGPDIARRYQKVDYNHFNLPKRVLVGQDDQQATVDLSYDAMQQRVRKHVLDPANGDGPLEQTTAYFDDLYERTETTVTGAGVHTIEHKYRVYAGGREIAEVLRDEQAGVIGDARVRYLHADALGSTQVITDETGATIDSQEYDPFGQSRSTASPALHTGFTGQEFDIELGLVNMRGRIYDPKLGRFTTPDPFVSVPAGLGLNRYAYVFNNPLRYVDPTGFDVGGDTSDSSGTTTTAQCDSKCVKQIGAGGGIAAAFVVGVVYGGPWLADHVFTPTTEWFGKAGRSVRDWVSGLFGSSPDTGSNTAYTPPPVYGVTVEQARSGAGGAGPGPGGPVGGGTEGGPNSSPAARPTAEQLPPGAHYGEIAPPPTAEQFQVWNHLVEQGKLDPATSDALQIEVGGAELPPMAGGGAMRAAIGEMLGDAAAAQALPRALTAADVGLSGRGIAELTGTALDAGGTRILTIDMIRAAEGATIPVGEIRSAIPTILGQARSSGITVLQIDASFANPRLQGFVFEQVTKYGGTAASVGGRDVMTFTLGGF